MSMSRVHTSNLGERLRARREALGMSLEKVGVAIGLDESSARARISRYELGVHEPPINTVAKLAQVLGVPEAYLYCRDERLAQIILAAAKLSNADQDGLLDSLRARFAHSKPHSEPEYSRRPK